MSMNFARFSVTRPVAVTMRIASLVLLGAVCLTKLPVDLLPAVSFPTVSVITAWPNVAPEELETQVTRPIEQAVSSASNIYQVSSSTTQGSSSVRIQFNYGTDIGQAAVDVLQLVDRARQKFPQDPTLQTPVVYKVDPSQLPILIYGVSGESDLVKLKSELNNEISPILQSASGVASAVATGGLDRAIIVDIDPNKLQSFHLSLTQVSSRIVQENLNLPAGIGKQSNTEYTIRSIGYFDNPAQVGEIPVGSYNGQLIALNQVATVSDSYQEQRLYTRLNGENAAGMIIVKQSGANTVDTAKNVQQKLKQVAKLYPNLQWHLAYDQSQFIVNSIDDVKNSAFIGGALAVIILMFFLGNFRSTLVVALSIPISIISTFALFYFCHFSLNVLSLSGISLATGLIVDDAVVVLENIFRHIERDKKRPTEAAVSGTMEITSAVVASTITIMVVFLPLLLIQGQAGQMFTQFALVVIFSIAVSLLDATTVVPMLASRLIKEEEIEEEFESHTEEGKAKRDAKKRGPLTRMFNWFGDRFDDLDHRYHDLLKWALHHRVWILGIAGLTLVFSALIWPQVGTEMLPTTDSGNYTVNVKMPVGTALEVTNTTMLKAEQIVLKDPDVETVFSAAGTTLSLRGSTTTQLSYVGSMTVRLKDDRKRSTQTIMADTQKKLAKLPGARAIVQPYDIVTQILSGGNTNLEFDIYGSNLTQLAATARDILNQVRLIPGMENADTNIQDAVPELQIKVDRQKALALGVTFSDVANALNTATNGTLSSYYQENGYEYPIYVQLPLNKRKSVAELQNLPITPGAGSSSGSAGGPGSTGVGAAFANPTSHYVLLSQIATITNDLGPSEITRQNSQRYIAITAVTSGRPQSQIQADVEKIFAAYKFPPGYYWDYGLQIRQQRDEFSGLTLAVGMAIALIYMLLAAQFESFIYPLTILVSVPLSTFGVVLALFLTGRAFGMTAFIGLLLLIGIVVKNGILLVDYTNQLRHRGLERDEAVLTASPTRLRPILMTTGAAVLGMLPLALGIGKGSETQAPLATAVIGGLLTSTMLTLFVVPVVFTLFDDLGHFFRKDRNDPGRTNGSQVNVEAEEQTPTHSETHTEPEVDDTTAQD